MFIRAKKIKGREYAYLVKNEWQPWGSRQKVTKYLGKIHKPKKTKNEHPKNKTTTYKEAIKQAIENELRNHGFKKKEGKMTTKGITADTATGEIKEGKRKAVLQMNEGYLCEYTIKNLQNFTPLKTPEKTLHEFARRIVEAGLKPPTEELARIIEHKLPV